MKTVTPTDQQFDTAVLWLQSNEGDGEEGDSCRAVAAWIDAWRGDRMIRQTARQAGVSVKKLRQHLAGRMAQPEEEEQ